MLRHDGLLARNSAASENTMLRKTQQIKRFSEILLKKSGDADKYEMSQWRTNNDIVWLNVSKMRGRTIECECQDKQQSLDDDGESRDEYLELF